MARTYTDTPEPRYVEKAKESETTSALPEIKNADRGKFLKVKSNKNEYELVDVPEVPTPTIADEGKVLGVDDEGEYALMQGGGGGGIPYVVEKYDDDTGDFLGFESNSDFDTIFESLAFLIFNNNKSLNDIPSLDTTIIVNCMLSGLLKIDTDHIEEVLPQQATEGEYFYNLMDTNPQIPYTGNLILLQDPDELETHPIRAIGKYNGNFARVIITFVIQ